MLGLELSSKILHSDDSLNEVAPSNLHAVEHDGRSFSYNQFCWVAGQLANRIQQLGLDSAAPVAIMMDRGFGVYASQFAVLSAGRFFLPIDPANPDERIKFLLSDSNANCILVDSSAAQRIRSLGLDLAVVEVEPELLADKTPESENIAPISFPHAGNDPAYMIYTSGSTGKPKGVCIHWDAICNHDRWFIDEYQLAVGDRCSQIASIGFDISIEQMFTTLRSGACLVSITK